MAMGSGKPRMASGEFVHTSGIAYIDHNLGSKKIFVIMQRVNADHANIDASSQYQSVIICGATVEALGLDEQQTYSINGGNQVSVNSAGSGINGAYPKGFNSAFPSATGTTLQESVMAYPDRAITAEDRTGASENTVRVYPVYGIFPGRWVWRAYALD